MRDTSIKNQTITSSSLTDSTTVDASETLVSTEALLFLMKEALPLQKRQQQLNADALKVHRAILRSFVEYGRPLQRVEISKLIQADVSVVLLTLQKNDLIVLNPVGEPVGAYPFTLNKTPHQLTINHHKIHAMCAFDAVGVSAMFNREVIIDSQCNLTGEPLRIRMMGKQVLETSHSEVRIGIHAQMPGDCAAQNLCPELVFLRDLTTAQQWLSKKENAVLLTLTEASEVSSAYFIPLLMGDKEEKLSVKEAKQSSMVAPSGQGITFWKSSKTDLGDSQDKNHRIGSAGRKQEESSTILLKSKL